MEELFKNRVIDSNIFTKEEIEIIINSDKSDLYKRCYLLGLIDKKF